MLALLLIGCRPDSPVDDGARADLSPSVQTVALVTWTSAEDEVAWVEFGTGLEYGSATPRTEWSEGEHTVPLLGLTPDTTIHFRVVHGDEPGPDHVIRTGSIPAGIPGLYVEATDANTLAGEFTLFPWYEVGEQSSWLSILNREGERVWYAEIEGQVLSAAFSLDGTAIVYLVSAEDQNQSLIGRAPLDGSPALTFPAPDAHHAAIELPDDAGYAYVASVSEVVDGEEIYGDQLMEISLEGDRRVVWDAFEELPVVENSGWAMDPPDWTHGNGVDYDPVTNRYLLSLYRQEQLVAIDRASGQTEWILGKHGDFALAGDAWFGPQHSPRWADGGVLLFDNAYTSSDSRLAQFALDEAAMTATLAWQVSPALGSVVVMGCVERLAGGGSVSTWGEQSRMLTMDDAGIPVRTVSIGNFGVTGQVSARDGLYPGE